jgi:hypothetical protein
MQVNDYNGEGQWSRNGILSRYARYAAMLGIIPRDLSPMELTDGERRWIYPVMLKVIEGIADGDQACFRLGIEFIEENAKFPFGKMLKSNTARALRRAPLTEEQKRRIRQRVFGMLRAGHIPREFREYARLVRKIGYKFEEVPLVDETNPYAVRFRGYFQTASRDGSSFRRGRCTHHPA